MKTLIEMLNAAFIVLLIAVALIATSPVKAETRTIYVAAACNRLVWGAGTPKEHVTEGCHPDNSRIFFDASEECKAYVKRVNETSDVNKGKKNGERTWLECFNKEISVWSR